MSGKPRLRASALTEMAVRREHDGYTVGNRVKLLDEVRTIAREIADHPRIVHDLVPDKYRCA
jgi:hypothetical protein